MRREVATVDYHAAGEPLRIVQHGMPPVPGATMLDKRRHVRRRLDHYRRFLMHEPRGHADMYGAILTEPVTDGADFGVLFMHNEGYSTMCGHGVIALVTAVLEQGLAEVADPQCIAIDTPAGRVTARARLRAGQVAEVSFENVPAFVYGEPGEASALGRRIPYVIAFGGAFYAYAEAAACGLQLLPGEAAGIIAAGRALAREVRDACRIRHPAGEPELDELYGVIFTERDPVPRQACVFADGELDRSPTGTGVSGRAAIRFARGALALGEVMEVASLIGTRFSVRCLRAASVGDTPAVITEVAGSASHTGTHTFVLSDNDPLPDGFLIR